MGTLLKQASSFLHDKYKTAKLALTDVTQAELLAEEATNNDPWGPDAKTMTIIAEHSFDIDDYWRIVDVLHKRFYSTDWKKWRQSYKALVLLDFLLTHGPEEFAEEFDCDTDIIEELGMFQYIDDKGFNWGVNMQKKSERVLQLLGGGQTLKEARLKALKITKEIQGFGSSASSPSSSSSQASRTSSFGSYSTATSAWNDLDHELNNLEQLQPAKSQENDSRTGIQDHPKNISSFLPASNVQGAHIWNCPTIQESGSLLDEDEEDQNKKNGIISGICSKLEGMSPLRSNGGKVTLRSFSDVGKVMKKKFDRQFSIGY